ncbi:hypothetical protein [Kordia zhangzhouensis]|uniref:hypothetical protein n=1 Tax=Kordia zhangzhouensis TaxID=1620405 RepID=UPI0006294C90|nr:hypothetical protein [Kordia zhangzhouensis]
MNLCTQNINQKIESVISSFFKKEYDLFLIGSRASDYFNENSDFDYILITNYKFEICILTKISNELNTKLNNIFKSKISVKVFDLASFENLYFQDYFRYLEYKISHEPIKNINKVFSIKFSDLTNEILFNQLINSILIQYWWSIITISNNPETEQKVLKKLKYRIRRNIELYNSITDSNISQTEIVKSIVNNTLYSKINKLDINNYKFFLVKYFDYFEHEMINKSNYYNYTLKEKFPNVRATINNIKATIYELA